MSEAVKTAIQDTPAEEALRKEYSRRYLEPVIPHCTEKLPAWGAAGSYGKPARYDCLFDSPEPAVYSAMKSAKKALVSTRNPVSHGCRYRFILRSLEGGWMVDGAECTLSGQESWGIEHSL